MRKVLIPINYHEPEERIREMCAELKMFGTREAVLLHVGSVRGKSVSGSKKKLAKYTALVKAAGLAVEPVIRPGNLQEQVVKTRRDRQADYIGMLFKKKSWAARAILGSRTKDVIRQAESPVLVSKKRGYRQAGDDSFTAILASSLKGGDEHLLDELDADSFRPDKLFFLHVGKRAPDPEAEKRRLEREREKLSALLKLCRFEPEVKEPLLLLGSPRRRIVGTARKYLANLIILGKSDGRDKREPVLGSTAEEVSYNAPCSVLIVPKRGELS